MYSAMAAISNILLSKNIRAWREADGLLFCMADVTAYIKDTHTDRIAKKYTEGYGEKFIKSIEFCDTQGRKRPMRFFTEKGLYKYLLQAQKPIAEEFQEYVYDLVVAERKRVVDEAQLEAKLARDALALERARHTRALKAARGFQLEESSTFDDYAAWCLERLADEHPLTAPEALSERETWILSYYFTKGLYKDGYEDLVSICLEGIKEPLPRLFREVVALGKSEAAERRDP